MTQRGMQDKIIYAEKKLRAVTWVTIYFSSQTTVQRTGQFTPKGKRTTKALICQIICQMN
jgi:hypothetical protein